MRSPERIPITDKLAYDQTCPKPPHKNVRSPHHQNFECKKKKNNRIVKKTNQNLIELPGFQTSDTVIYNTPRITVLVSFSWRTFLDCRTQWHYSIEKQKKKKLCQIDTTDTTESNKPSSAERKRQLSRLFILAVTCSFWEKDNF